MQRPPTTNQQYSVLAATQCPQSTALYRQEALTDTVCGWCSNQPKRLKKKQSAIIVLHFRILRHQLHKYGEHLNSNIWIMINSVTTYD